MFIESSFFKTFGGGADIYLGSRVDQGSSLQQLLHQVLMALLGCEVEGVETVLEENRSPSKEP